MSVILTWSLSRVWSAWIWASLFSLFTSIERRSFSWVCRENSSSSSWAFVIASWARSLFLAIGASFSASSDYKILIFTSNLNIWQIFYWLNQETQKNTRTSIYVPHSIKFKTLAQIYGLKFQTNWLRKWKNFKTLIWNIHNWSSIHYFHKLCKCT